MDLCALIMRRMGKQRSSLDIFRSCGINYGGFNTSGEPQMDRKLYKESQVTQIIRSNRLRWLGHVWRTPENNPTRLHTFKNPGGARAQGRPSTRWLDDTENYFKILKIKNWQRVALDRMIGRSVLSRQLRPATGCYAPKEEEELLKDGK
ncbi:hypothetical protein AVEN_148298-1 [Araneus ventricosus]|uniref:Uncharacterized protein n=1 Tax=Araneus ventricosus TaxID=182803 RepID=A0A4Y2FWA6_ARAVE|nr:hypothetical protein AVEN_148298-1 [Araneus ventricosus]